MRSVKLWMGICCLLACAAASYAQDSTPPALRGTVTDPSGARIPGAVVQWSSPGVQLQATTDARGQYAFATLKPGKYSVWAVAAGFKSSEKTDVEIAAEPVTVDFKLDISVKGEVLNVEAEAKRVSSDPESNGSALVLKDKELEALSDDPDELAQQLQAMAGPGSGPNGGQIDIDGFSNGQLPTKSSIREIRINTNPYSPEYDRPGFGRIEIFTKPGSDTIRGQAYFQFNDESLNSRSPLLAQSTRPAYQQKSYGFSLSGPLKKERASYGFDFERRNVTENAFILATTLDDNFNFVNVNQAVLSPQVRTSFAPRVDFTINPRNTLAVRYQNVKSDFINEGVGNFNLASQAYDETSANHTLQITETAVLSPKAINETRFQFARSRMSNSGDVTVPAITVQGAFSGGGAQIGESGSKTSRLELSNISTYTHRTHTLKWGARGRRSYDDDTSENNFGGSFTFFGGTGPELDAAYNPIAGTAIHLSAIERYRRTLLFQSMGLSTAEIRLLGGGASQFSIRAGTRTMSVSQFDVGLFGSDDWRLRPNFTLSYGLRYETQNNISDHANWSPRLGVAWGVDGGRNKTAKTVLRTGFGTFFDRVSDSVTLQALRFNGMNQLSYLILNPDFYPNIPDLASLETGKQPQQLQLKASDIQAPRSYQAMIGIDRQVNKSFRLSFNYVNSRGVHLLRARNLNAPIDGVYPYGDAQVRMLTETTGFSRTNQFMISPNLNYKQIFLFGFYSLSYGKSDAEGQAADPYNLRAEWGPSGFADVRHRFVIGTNVPLPMKLNVSPFITANSGAPYNITTGRDTNGDGFTNERPQLLANVSAASCTGGNMFFADGFGCFNLSPASGTAIERNYGRGPANFMVNLRFGRTWSFGSKGESGPADSGGPPPGGGGMRGGGPPGGGPGGGGPPPGGGPGGPGGVFGGSSGKKYNLTLNVMVRNLLNHPNFGSPSGDLSSPYFGVYRSLAGFGPMGGGNTTYNRKIDIQLRFTF